MKYKLRFSLYNVSQIEILIIVEVRNMIELKKF